MPGDKWHSNAHWQDMVNVILGLLLFIAPWALGYVPAAVAEGEEAMMGTAAMTAASWNSWIAGGIVVVIAVAALLKFFEWEEWVEGAVGLWIAISPWILGFTELRQAMVTHLILGVLVLVLAGWDVYAARHAPPEVKA